MGEARCQVGLSWLAVQWRMWTPLYGEWQDGKYTDAAADLWSASELFAKVRFLEALQFRISQPLR